MRVRVFVCIREIECVGARAWVVRVASGWVVECESRLSQVPTVTFFFSHCEPKFEIIRRFNVSLLWCIKEHCLSAHRECSGTGHFRLHTIQ